ncbi:DNA damage-inducible transcript 3 protein isoform X4 [Osmerus eperlanus]|uniref:DNA damage-inducible transcript 3 protein isoform X4 n=1 Tax=Osmerus eperlanus TaxID=29151 RepID=UPI002E1607D1
MTAEWLHLPPPYPPGVGPLCGAELEAWYEDLQDILGSDAGGAKLTRPPPCSEKEPEFLDVLESCSLTWLTDGGQGSWGEAVVQRVTEESSAPHHDHTSSSSSSMSPDELEGERAREGEASGGDLLPPEFFELLSEGGVGMMENGGVAVGGGYHHLPHHHTHHHGNVQPASPSSEEELPCVPDSPSCSSSSCSQSPSHNCSPPSSPPSKVQELSEQNEHLKAEIDRLGEEVQRTRRALIERLVNTRK